MSTRIIVNPNAADGAGKKDWPKVEKAMRAAGVEFDAVFTEGPGHATQLARKAAEEGCDRVLAVGGDGTVHEIVNGLMAFGVDADSRPAFGIVPTGTGGDLCRTMGICHDFEGAVKIFCGGAPRYMDLGLMEYHKDGVLDKRYFDNITGVGFDGETSTRMNTNNLKIRGTLPYILAFFQTLLKYKNRKMRIEIDDESFEAVVNMLVVANGKYFGGGMMVAPGAVPDDGFFEVVLFGDLGKLEQIFNGMKIYKGTHINHPKLKVFKARKVRVVWAELPTFVEPDGEVIGHVPVSFEVVPRAIRVVCPCQTG